jgi:hypothetical protein
LTAVTRVHQVTNRVPRRAGSVGYENQPLKR